MKKKSKILWLLLIISFIIFMFLYICKETGYYEYKTYEKVVLTDEAIKRFEEDVYNGKDVNAKDYITIEEKDYSNKFSILGSKLGEITNTFMNKTLKNIIKVLSKLFWE